jgi:phosphotransferase system enzyme I (PtsI)
MKETIYSGTAVSPGMAQGKAFVVGMSRLESIPFASIREEEVQPEVEKFWTAVEISISELQSLMKRVRVQIGERESRMFEAHLMMLKDRHVGARIAYRIDFEKISAETAVVRTILDLIQSFRGHGDELRQKFSSDFRDLGLRLIRNLSPFFTYDKSLDLTEPVIVVARELIPSIVMRLDRKWILGFVTETGNSGTHAGLLARSMGTVAIAGIKDFFEIKNNDLLLLDGRTGKVMLNPVNTAQDLFRKSYEVFQKAAAKPEKLMDKAAKTGDGEIVHLLANIWLPGDIEIAEAIGAEEVGLIRTEFAYLFGNKLPSEESVYEYHKSLAEKVWKGPVTFRLLDVGGETDLPEAVFKSKSGNENGLRFLLKEKDIFRIQLRSILKIAAFKPVRMVYPFFNHLTDLHEANQRLEEVKKDLEAGKAVLKETVEVGALIETVEAVEEMDAILKEVKFVVIGSNDLALNLLGRERSSQIDLSDFKLLTPSLIRVLTRILESCRKQSRPCYVSGKMAEDPGYLGFLVGLGFRHFNVAGAVIPDMKEWLSRIKLSDLVKIARDAGKIFDDESLREYLLSNIPKDIENKDEYGHFEQGG